MATTFALDHLGAKFQVNLTDCVTDNNIDVSTVVEQFIVFYKPNGITFEKSATLEVEGSDSLITYTNTAPEVTSILDLIGNWEFAGKIKLSNNDSFQSSERFVFWVS